MRSFNRRILRLLVASALLLAARNVEAEQSPMPRCVSYCANGAMMYCAGQTPAWCSAWIGGCMVGCGSS